MRSNVGEWKNIYKEDPLEVFVESIMETTSDKTRTIFQQTEDIRRQVAAIFMQGKLSADAKWSEQMKKDSDYELNNPRL